MDQFEWRRLPRPQAKSSRKRERHARIFLTLNGLVETRNNSVLLLSQDSPVPDDGLVGVCVEQNTIKRKKGYVRATVARVLLRNPCVFSFESRQLLSSTTRRLSAVAC